MSSFEIKSLQEAINWITAPSNSHERREQETALVHRFALVLKRAIAAHKRSANKAMPSIAGHVMERRLLWAAMQLCCDWRVRPPDWLHEPICMMVWSDGMTFDSPDGEKIKPLSIVKGRHSNQSAAAADALVDLSHYLGVKLLQLDKQNLSVQKATEVMAESLDLVNDSGKDFEAKTIRNSHDRGRDLLTPGLKLSGEELYAAAIVLNMPVQELLNVSKLY